MFDELLEVYYDNKKGKKHKRALDMQHFWTKLIQVSSMFKREGLPEEIDPGVIEPNLLLTGMCAYVKEGGKYIVGRCALTGEPTRYYYGKDAIVTAGNGFNRYYKDWETNPNIVVAFNNAQKLPDYQLWKTASFLTEIDISLICNLIYSRLYPIGVAHDDKTKAVLEQLFDNMMVGKFASITSKNIMEQLTGKDGTGIDVLNLTDVSVSDKIQYLAKFRDDMDRWFWSQYGQNVQATSKLAQESVSEVTSGEGVSMIMPHAMLHERMKECENLKKKFGLDVTVCFTEPWQNQFADCASEDDTPATAEKGAVNVENNNDKQTVD